MFFIKVVDGNGFTNFRPLIFGLLLGDFRQYFGERIEKEKKKKIETWCDVRERGFLKRESPKNVREYLCVVDNGDEVDKFG